jgi:hypothetical protein
MGSAYLSKPPRTLRAACRDVAATNPELIVGHCETCANGALCALYDGIERDRPGAAEMACPGHRPGCPGPAGAMKKSGPPGISFRRAPDYPLSRYTSFTFFSGRLRTGLPVAA